MNRYNIILNGCTLSSLFAGANCSTYSDKDSGCIKNLVCDCFGIQDKNIIFYNSNECGKGIRDENKKEFASKIKEAYYIINFEQNNKEFTILVKPDEGKKLTPNLTKVDEGIVFPYNHGTKGYNTSGSKADEGFIVLPAPGNPNKDSDYIIGYYKLRL